MSPSRKDALRTFAIVPPAVIVAATGFVFPDEDKTSKQAVDYQDKPKNGQLCATCIYFVSGNGKNGACKIVEGNISPEGWCSDYATPQRIPKTDGKS